MRLLPWLLLLVLAGCQRDLTGMSRMLAGEAPQGEPYVDRRRTWFDPAKTVMRSETFYLVQPDGLEVAHGTSREWYLDGQPKFEREFHRGEPIGHWRAWYADGQLRSESYHDATPEPMPVRWWYADGQLSTEGWTLDGVRVGAWRGWHTNGQPEYQGAYRAGRREGRWTFWYPDGELAEEGEYRDGERVGAWYLGPNDDGPQ